VPVAGPTGNTSLVVVRLGTLEPSHGWCEECARRVLILNVQQEALRLYPVLQGPVAKTITRELFIERRVVHVVYLGS